MMSFKATSRHASVNPPMTDFFPPHQGLPRQKDAVGGSVIKEIFDKPSRSPLR